MSLLRIGIPRERKDGERRVGATPDGVRVLVAAGHPVVVESGAGAAVGFADAAYEQSGATIAREAEPVWACALVVKVKEIQAAEFSFLVRGTTILGYAQLNRDPRLLAAVLAAGVGIIGCETVRDAAGGLPLLAPMSRIAGRLAPLVGARLLMQDGGGSGVMLCGVDDVPGASVVVVGAGNVSGEAARIAARTGARVTVFSRGERRRLALSAALLAEGLAVASHPLSAAGDARFEDTVAAADLVIGGVLEPGTLSPKLISRATVAAMRPGSVLVDVGIDQGGIAETSRMTSLSAPAFVECQVIHYAVPNMPALVARTATLAYAAAALPVVRKLATLGINAAIAADPGIAAGLMVRGGEVVHTGLARDAGMPSHSSHDAT